MSPAIPGAARLIDLGGIPANTTIEFDSELSAYEIANLRWGFGTDKWEAGVFVVEILSRFGDIGACLRTVLGRVLPRIGQICTGG